ncbi:MAG: tRNA dihydrouridine(20/20a) synthase DusA [Robiginitomaculum sp.]|nr:tRNA dihydrouridine(20/20a) synthase DusA [Robiginitomaculum sp.]
MINQGFTFAVAPMMDWTDRHCRVFHRMLTKRAFLYTEMVVADAVIHGDRPYLIGYNECEHPVALQIGGSDPHKLAEASTIGAGFGYDEINLNVGCPSDRVQSGQFGASLMANPKLVADCFTAMQNAVDIPVTIKCRIGIDDQETHNTLPHFIETVSGVGCEHFIIHARKAWLDGLSPKDNRTVPPLDYDLVREMKSQYPRLSISLNGGLETLAQAQEVSQGLDGVMFGRAAYHNPWILSRVDGEIYGEKPQTISRDEIVMNLIDYAKTMEIKHPSTKALVRHVMGLYHGETGARIWRRALSEADASLPPSQKIKLAFAAIKSVQESHEILRED